MRNSPSCACCAEEGECATCTVYTNDFSTDFRDFTRTGTWVISSDKALAAGAGTLTLDEPHPYGSAMRVEVNLSELADGKKWRVFCAATKGTGSALSYIGAEFQAYSDRGELRLLEYEDTGGPVIQTVLGMVVVSRTAAATLGICHRPTANARGKHSTAYCISAGGTYNEVIGWNVTDTGEQAGIHAAASGDHGFDNFNVYATKDEITTTYVPCLVESEDFDSAIPDGWVQEAGTWTASSGLSTNDDNAYIVSTTDQADVVLSCRVSLADVSDVVRLHTRYLDSTHNQFVEISSSGGNLKMRLGYQDGASTVITATNIWSGVISTNEFKWELFTCGDVLQLRAHVVFGGEPYSEYSGAAGPSTGTKVALNSGSSSGPAVFTEFRTYNHRSTTEPECPSADLFLDCEECVDCTELNKLTYLASASNGDPYDWEPEWTASDSWEYDNDVAKGTGTLESNHDVSNMTGGTSAHILIVSVEENTVPGVGGNGLPTGTDTTRVVLDADDINNGHYIEFEAPSGGSGVVKIGDVTGGSDTELLSTFYDEDFGVWAKLENDRIYIKLPSGSPFDESVAVTPKNGGKVFLTASGDVRIANLLVTDCDQ